MRRLLNPGAFNEWVYRVIDDYSHRVEVYCGGAGSGKSHGAMQKVLLKAINRRRRVLVIRKVAATLRDSVFALALRLLAECGEREKCRVNRGDFEIELANGSAFLFKGLDDEQKIKSIAGITDIVIEEATELTRNDFTQLNLRLRPVEPDPQIFLMFNPVSKSNWVYETFFAGAGENALEGAPLVISTTHRDNKFLPESYRAELERLRHTNPAYWRVYAKGEFVTPDKLVFPSVERRIIREGETRGLPGWCGLDFGYVHDPTALTWGRYDGAGRTIYVTGEYSAKGMSNGDIADAAKALGLSNGLITADSAEPKSISELRRAGLLVKPAGKGPGSVMYGIGFMLSHAIVADERLARVNEEFDNYTWSKDSASGEYINRPAPGHDHHIDGIRYGMEQFFKRGGEFVLIRRA
jgi:phage terminase large subunit